MAFQFIQDSGKKGITSHTWNTEATGHQMPGQTVHCAPRVSPVDMQQTCLQG